MSFYIGRQASKLWKRICAETSTELKLLFENWKYLLGGLICQVLRDEKWKEEDAVLLVPGDIVSIKLGDIVPSDARLLEGDALKIGQFALTGESLPVTKNPGDGIYSGSTCKQGEIDAVIIATGVNFLWKGCSSCGKYYTCWTLPGGVDIDWKLLFPDKSNGGCWSETKNGQTLSACSVQ